MADIAASVLAKLKNKAKASGISYQQCLQLFFQEEFLRRLSGSKYAENFVLKGGLFIYTLTNFESRATVDVDFLMRGLNNDLARMDEIIAEILAVNTGNDFVTFKAGKTEPIAVQRKYHGVSTQITGYIKNVRVPFNVDIGVGDVIVPDAQRRNIQTQLDGYEKPEILTYSLESTIAEKFDAILQRYELTGRMKDFYDIYYLSQTFNFDGLKLRTAIQETLQKRGTTYDKDSFDRVVALESDEDMQIKWRYFLKTLGNPELPFEQVIRGIKTFLEPIWDAIINEDEFGGKWYAFDGQWLYRWQRAMQKSLLVDKKLDGLTAGLLKFSDCCSVLPKVDLLGKPLLAVADMAAAQTRQLDGLLTSPTVQLVADNLRPIDASVVRSIEASAKMWQSPAVQATISTLDSLNKTSVLGAISAVDQLAKVTRLFNTPSVMGQLNRVASQLDSLDSSVITLAKSFDWSLVEIGDSAIRFDGVEYTPEALEETVETQLAEAKTEKLPLRERLECWKEKLWALLMILSLLSNLPDVPEKVEFYRHAIAQIQEYYDESPQVCYTIKERSILREEPNSDAKRIMYLPYDTALEILDEIPRWYQVKYTTANNEELIGWISKISVEEE